MKKLPFVAALAVAALSIGGVAVWKFSSRHIYGPEDYVHFSPYFTMNESTANEMVMDGGSPMAAPMSKDPEARILLQPAADDKIAQALTQKPKDSPAIEID